MLIRITTNYMMADGFEGNDSHKLKPKERKQSKKTKTSARAKKDEKQQRLKEIETSIRSQVAAEERAHDIVERLVLEDFITEDFLINSGNLITTSHYADVVVERMLSKKCGYPLCKNTLNQIPAQKYKIFVKTSRVYDITERKCFCSNFCYKASKYFESQISDSPVWTRIGESHKMFVLLKNDNSTSRNGSGEVLLEKDSKQENVSDGAKDDCIMDHDKSGKSLYGETACNSVETFRERDSLITSHENSSIYSENNPPKNLSSSLCTSFLACGPEKSVALDHLLDKTDLLLEKPEQIPNELDLLPNHLLKVPAKSLRKTLDSGKVGSEFTSESERKLDFDKKLLNSDAVIKSARTMFQEWCTHSTFEYLGLSVKPKAAGVTLEAKDKDPESFMARALQFFQAAMNDSEDSDCDAATDAGLEMTKGNIVIKENKSPNQDKVCNLPPIDSKSQITIRRRIVLERLFRTMPDLLSEVKLTVGEVSHDVTQLVHTFSLNSKNITLKPLQWRILSLALILILERKNSRIAKAMESSKKNFDALLARLEITRKDLELVLSPLFEAQCCLVSSCVASNNGLVETFESREENNKIYSEEREDFGDMEELD